MIFRKYGRTEVEVSAIGFGGMRFNDQEDADQCAGLVKAAYDAGINYFDTAPGYGKSEELFGVAFKEMLRTRDERPFYVSTKTDKPDPEAIRKDFETSLERMGLDYIDFHHMWYILKPAVYEERKAKGALKEFEKLLDEGLVRHLCVSTHMEGSDIRRMLDDYPFEGVLLGYSVANCAYRGEGIQAASEKDMGVVVMNPLNGGFIPQHAELFEYAKSREDETVVEAALRFLLDDERITIALVGLSTEEQLKEAVSAVDGYQALDPEFVAGLKDDKKERLNKVCTSCCYCDSCPEEINVPGMMETYNSFMFHRKAERALGWLKANWDVDIDTHGPDKCVECGRCEELCTQKLPIMERLKDLDAAIKEHQAKSG